MTILQTNSVRRRRPLAILAIACSLLLASAWCYGRLAQGRRSADDAASDLADCRAAAGRIESLRQRPAVADSQETRDADLFHRIDQAGRAAHFDDGAVEQISPESSRPVGTTSYREKPTQVRLKRVTTQQLFTFLHALAGDASGGPGLNLKSLRLSAPRGDDPAERWTAEVTLTYLVFDPKIQS